MRILKISPLTNFQTYNQSVQLLSRVWFFQPHGLQHARLLIGHQLLELAQIHVHQVGDAIQPSHSSVVPFSSCFQSFPASGSFPVSQFFASGGQSIGVSASVSVLHMTIQDWVPLGLCTTGDYQRFPALPTPSSSLTTWLAEVKWVMWQNHGVHLCRAACACTITASPWGYCYSIPGPRIRGPMEKVLCLE